MTDQQDHDRPRERGPNDDNDDQDDVPAVPPTEPEPVPIEEPPTPEKPSGYIV